MLIAVFIADVPLKAGWRGVIRQMAIAITEGNLLRSYAESVMTDDDAWNVKCVMLILLGGVIWNAEPGSLRLRQTAGRRASVLFFSIRNSRYLVRCNSDKGNMEIWEDGVAGKMIGAFDDRCAMADIKKVFATFVA